MVRNLTRQTVLARTPRLADSFLWRARGMIGRRFTSFDALVFDACGAIHMCFMLIALDVVFVDAEHRVCGLREGLKPWRLASARTAVITVELPVGAIAAAATRLGDQLDFDGMLAP